LASIPIFLSSLSLVLCSSKLIPDSVHMIS
jgi:hypothetical protein